MNSGVPIGEHLLPKSECHLKMYPRSISGLTLTISKARKKYSDVDVLIAVVLTKIKLGVFAMAGHRHIISISKLEN